ncbi:type II toxin-antitoxin system RelE/ParE family toxin [Flavobacterium sp. CYK-55]|uniref:type II toxin-antitoxin system RelE/ParE family toxin n=1 Tax=Flavobacterium sp. CYK-55 TaxID=2835529 RepID=UPI001BD010C1|nr:type II toxin-antitoxin system RelE/ParE family toxin [Flavobacterium sp. CYK-55]MBS7788297.1 type II toxin-antitoxin system RelE/ParE family toxin [Flavobacterium sp. CYK-55]
MTNGYKIFWTEFALSELEKTIEYLEENWTEKELKSLAFEIEKTLSLISHNPNIFQVSEIKKDIRRAVISKLNTMYYRVNGETVEILSFFSNRQNPKKRKLK